MKTALRIIMLLLCTIACALFSLDLFINTQPSTGFLQSGTVLTRYALLAVIVILVAVLCFILNKNKPAFLNPSLAFRVLCFLAFLGCIISSAGQLFLFTMQLTDIFQTLISILMLVGGFWFLGLCVNGKSIFGLGLLLVASQTASVIYTFLTTNSSMHHITIVSRMVVSLACLMFSTYLFKILSIKSEMSQGFFTACGIISFLTGVCILIPLQIWEFATANIYPYTALQSLWFIPIALIGILVVFQKGAQANADNAIEHAVVYHKPDLQ